jgi:hypothetical protein
VLYVIVCGAGPAPYVGRLVEQAQGKGWAVCLVATPVGRGFLDVAALEELTGRPVRSQYGEPAKLPHADAVIVAPATYNTINKWAAGIADTFALGLLAELTGMGLPIAVLPFVNTAYAANRVFARSVAELRDAGVAVLYGPGAFEPHPPGTGGTRLDGYPWHLALDAVTAS